MFFIYLVFLLWQDRPNFNENDKNYLPVLATELQAELQELQDVGRLELQASGRLSVGRRQSSLLG